MKLRVAILILLTTVLSVSSRAGVPTNNSLELGHGFLVAGFLNPAAARRNFGVRVDDLGVVDTTYGTNGVVNLVHLPTVITFISETAVSQQKLVAATVSCSPTPINCTQWLTRYTESGAPDDSFGDPGTPGQLNLGTFKTILANRVFPFAAKLYVDQTTGTTTTAGGSIVAVRDLVRYLPNGSVDTDFGVNGHVAYANRATRFIERNGRVVFAQNNGGIEIGRLQNDGGADPSFAGGGVTTMPFDTAADGFQQNDGKLVFLSNFGGTNAFGANNLTVQRLREDGTIDTTFGVGGVAVVPSDFSELGRVAAETKHGKVLVAGYREYVDGQGRNIRQLVLYRLNEDGSVDSSFGTNGLATVFFRADQGDSFLPSHLFQLSGGRIIVYGNMIMPTISPSREVFAVAAFTADGQLDTAFGTNGTATYNP